MTLRLIPAPYLIMRRLPGEPAFSATLGAEDRAVVLRQLGRYLAAIHSVPLAGFGTLVSCGDAYVGQSPSLSAYVRDEGERRLARVATGVLPPDLAAAIRRQLERICAGLRRDRAVLIHGDYQFKNILVQGACVSGILDFENLIAGDPVMDFAALHYWSPDPEADLRHLCAGYGQWRPTGQEFFRRLYLYELLLGLEILRWEEHFQDRPGIERARARLDALVVTLGTL
jgi:aminoglycoside phosphotransferase (APT) family kinase protein